MKITKWLFVLVMQVSWLSSPAQSPIKVILDTDIDSDVDDVGAIAMLHTLADHQVIDILGMIVTSNDSYSASCTDALNHYFNRPDIPIGVEKGVALGEHSRYTRQITENFEHDLLSYDEADDATVLYRQLLADQADSSVVIISIGHLTNLRNLLESKPDSISELSGIELINKKVKLWSCMGGHFPQGKEANFYRPDPESTEIAIKNWPGKIVFAGWEIGNTIITGATYLRASLPSTSPVWQAYRLYNNFQGRQSWDQVAVLYAIASQQEYWDLYQEGEVLIAKDGSNRWEDGDKTNQGYLTEKMSPAEIAKIIDALMSGIYHSTF